VALDRGIRSAYGNWPEQNRRLVAAVGRLTDEQLLLKPAPDRWPLWASIGHLACQRVFWLCDFAREPGAGTTRFTNAGWNCPGDDDLENVLTSAELVDSLDSTFAIIEGCLDRWSLESLDEIISHPEWDDARAHSRGWVLQRVFSHDVWHAAELNEALTAKGWPLLDFWD
jgi:DinB superfamily